MALETAPSTWQRDVTFPHRRPALPERVDVAIVGAGITGLVAAAHLTSLGHSVVVLEAREVAGGTTGRSTAKVSVLQGSGLADIAKAHGEAAAFTHARAQQAGFDLVAALVERLDCGARRVDAHLVAESDDTAETLETVVTIGMQAGQAVTVTESSPWPGVAVAWARDQVAVDPVRLSVAIADDLGCVLERARVLGVESSQGSHRVVTDIGTVTAGRVLLAMGLPQPDGGLLFARCRPVMSHTLVARLADPAPDALLLTLDEPTRSLRLRGEDPREVVAGGFGHAMGDADPGEQMAALEAWLRGRHEVLEVRERWSAHDLRPLDHLPFVGEPDPDRAPGLHVAFGWDKWGFANAGAAALALGDALAGTSNAWGEIVRPTRSHAHLSQVVQLAKDGASVARHLVGDRLKARVEVADIAPGSGALAEVGGRTCAVSRSADGTVTAVQAECTHLGCLVGWNTVDRTWDCPCHGSRFAASGEVLQGPATTPLSPVG